jgi:drug/metabolite transporter (DMT)-like permease
MVASLTADPHLNPAIGLLATIGASLASGLAGIYFEKVLRCLRMLQTAFAGCCQHQHLA